jgi:hypothetical protein
LCEPLETTANGKRLVVEDSAACQKTIQTPASQQVLKTDGANNLTWTNGANNTVLGKDSTGKVEFATINSVLQVSPVDLGSQPLTTTGAVSTGAITATSLTSTGAANVGSLTATGAASVASLASNGAVTAKTVAITNPASTTALTINQSLFGDGVVINTVDGTALSIQSTNTNPLKGGSLDFFPTTLGEMVFDGAGDGIFAFNNTSAAGTKATSFLGANVGIGTSAPVNTLHVAGTAKVDGFATVGNITITAAALATTVGAAGGASALPATPSGYIQITINGTPYKLPYYPV